MQPGRQPRVPGTKGIVRSRRAPADVQLLDVAEQLPELGWEFLEAQRNAVFANGDQVRTRNGAIVDLERGWLDAMFVPMEEGNPVSHVDYVV